MDKDSLEDIIYAYNRDLRKLFNKIEEYLPKVDLHSIRCVDDVVALFIKDTHRKSFVSSIYECKNCKGNNVFSRQEQRRGADEPSTTVLSCNDCGHCYAQNN